MGVSVMGANVTGVTGGSGKETAPPSEKAPAAEQVTTRPNGSKKRSSYASKEGEGAGGGEGRGGGGSTDDGDDASTRVLKSMRAAMGKAGASKRVRFATDDPFEKALQAMQPPEGGGQSADGRSVAAVEALVGVGAPEELDPPSSDAPIEASALVAEPSADAPPARDPRLQGFRIGGQAETPEERGEGWCGPWSTASRLLEARAQAKAARLAELGGATPEPLVKWTPLRNTNRPRAQPSRGVPSLQQLGVHFIAEHIEGVSSLGVLPPAVLSMLTAELARRRKLTGEVLPLFAEEGVVTSDWIVSDCHLIDEPALLSALDVLLTPP